jgi:hypothetical protein
LGIVGAARTGIVDREVYTESRLGPPQASLYSSMSIKASYPRDDAYVELPLQALLQSESGAVVAPRTNLFPQSRYVQLEWQGHDEGFRHEQHSS